MPAMIDLTGEKFGRLTVVRKTDERLNKKIVWECACDCGSTVKVRGGHLKSGHTTSCGCVVVEMASTMNKTHGKSRSRLYVIHRNMISRCNNTKSEFYKYYGGRGVKVCDGWRMFEPFYEWAIENGYRDGLTIDRVDVNSGYSPSNCEWVTKEENTRRANLANRAKRIKIEDFKVSMARLMKSFSITFADSARVFCVDHKLLMGAVADRNIPTTDPCHKIWRRTL